MFSGTYQHSLDEKGRIILPARFRPALSQGCVVTSGQERCIYGFAREEWTRWTQQLVDARVSDPRVRKMQRVIFASAHDDEPDRQGRLTLPEHLRRYAVLEREATIIGVGRRFEIWDRGTWERYRDEAEPEYADIAEALPELPI